MSRKELLARLVYRTGLLRPAAGLAPSVLVILGYHRIRPDGPHTASPFDEGVMGPTQSEFDRQVRWLRHNTDLLAEADLLALLRTRPRGRHRFSMITFDDGYRDNYDLAYPVLRANRAPAIWFVCPELLDSRRLGWWDLIAYLVKQSPKRAININGLEIPAENAIPQLHAWMKRRPAAETAGLIDWLAEACGVPLPSAALQDAQLLEWPQVREAASHGVAIGSHTYTHRVLATLNEAAQRWELAESKKQLERRLGAEVRTLAYPVGGYSFTSRTMELARECGYEAAFSFRTGANAAGAIQPFNIRRVAAGAECDAMFACGAVFPSVFHWSESMPAGFIEGRAA